MRLRWPHLLSGWLLFLSLSCKRLFPHLLAPDLYALRFPCCCNWCSVIWRCGKGIWGGCFHFWRVRVCLFPQITFLYFPWYPKSTPSRQTSSNTLSTILNSVSPKSFRYGKGFSLILGPPLIAKSSFVFIVKNLYLCFVLNFLLTLRIYCIKGFWDRIISILNETIFSWK